MILTDCDIEVGGGAAIRITRPRCPCGGVYAVEGGSIACKGCGKPLHAERRKKEGRSAVAGGDGDAPEERELFEDEDGD